MSVVFYLFCLGFLLCVSVEFYLFCLVFNGAGFRACESVEFYLSVGYKSSYAQLRA
jgi:hypothetical protein